MKKQISVFKQWLKEILDFKSRIWVVNIYEGKSKGESFVINEDTFVEPLQWMKRKNYPKSMLTQVDSMGCSQILELELGKVKHRLMRVK